MGFMAMTIPEKRIARKHTQHAIIAEETYRTKEPHIDAATGKDADNRERGGKHEEQTYKQSQKHDVRKGQLALRMFVPDTRHRVSTSNFASSFPPRQKHGTRHIFSDACLLDSKAVILSAGLYGSAYFVASIEDYMHGQVGPERKLTSRAGGAGHTLATKLDASGCTDGSEGDSRCQRCERDGNAHHLLD